MKIFFQRFIVFLFVILIGLAAAWIVHPSGSRINLNKLGINYQKDFAVNLGLDLRGGAHLVYQADFSEIEESDQREALVSVRETIERRVNSFGVSEPVVQIQGNDQIIAELPGVTDVNEAIDLIGQTPLLEFRVQRAENELPQQTIGEDGQLLVDQLSMWAPTGLSGKNLRRATADVQQGAGARTEIVVRLEFDDEGTKLFSELTQANIGRPIAIVLDGQVIQAPTVQNAITNGEAVITGGFTPDEAKQLATRLNSGALPVPINLISQQNVGASLGQESIEKSLLAGLIGLLMVALFMMLYYRWPGMLSVLALIIYALVSIAIFKIGISITAIVLVGIFFLLGIVVNGWFGVLALISYVALIFLDGVQSVTLTLAGIAGFILSIGMAVDANILIFERMKEELRSGKDLNKAINDGFARAWLSIRDSNVSTLISTMILYMFGTPAIKGFAITLSIGVLISMFSAITATRIFLTLLMNPKIARIAWLLGMKLPTANQERS
ncbi:MAG TPA: protein translocase subunit SecD [Candidatus Doudnabacteria bacterium]|nr:protein translocase subunit SecD [Candidatus Doudnabacteria bacterium]